MSKKLKITSNALAPFIGPPLDEGALPALFYFSISAEESLQLDPFNQPVAHLTSDQLRIFSMTIPGHEEGLAKEKAIQYWAQKMREGVDLLSPFFDRAAREIDDLVEKGVVLKDQCALAGLSRGSFVACHIAAQLPYIRYLCGFAPLVNLSFSREFQDIKRQAAKFDAEHLIPKLYNRTMRFYIGNRDLLVGTENAFEFVRSITEAAYEKRIRSVPIELLIKPSIGYLGHGTAPEVFSEGADWIGGQIL